MKKNHQSVHSNGKVPMQTTEVLIYGKKIFSDFLTKYSLGNVNSKNLQQSSITS